MPSQSLPQGNVVLRLEFSIADAVHQRGLVAVIGAAIHAWWRRPQLPPELPAYLRDDVGISPVHQPAHWLDVPHHQGIPAPLWRPGM